jgi:hypothetical protein
MSMGISSLDFVDQWSLSFADIDFINSKPAATRLGLVAQLKFFSARGFFAEDGTLVPHDAADYLAEQIGVRADDPGLDAILRDGLPMLNLDMLRVLVFDSGCLERFVVCFNSQSERLCLR